MRYTILILLMAIAQPLVAAEEATGSTSGWLTAVIAALTVIIGWVANLFRKKVASDAEQAELDKTKTVWEQKNLLIDQRIIPFAVSTGEQWLMLNVAPILIDATDGGGFQWSDHYTRLKAYVKDEVIQKFARENVDVLEHLAEKDLDSLLDRLLTKLITNLPDSISKFIPDGVADKLTDYAVEFVKSKAAELAE